MSPDILISEDELLAKCLQLNADAQIVMITDEKPEVVNVHISVFNLIDKHFCFQLFHQLLSSQSKRQWKLVPDQSMGHQKEVSFGVPSLENLYKLWYCFAGKIDTSYIFEPYLWLIKHHQLEFDLDKWMKQLIYNINNSFRFVYDDTTNILTAHLDALYYIKTILDPSQYVYLEDAQSLLIELSIASHKINWLVERMGYADFTSFIKKTNHKCFYLHILIAHNSLNWFQIVQALLPSDYPIYNNEGNSFLHICGDNEESFDIALMNTPDINHKNKKGQTPLLLAALNGHLSKARLLLLNKADPLTTNSKGENFWTIKRKPAYDIETNALKHADALNLYRDYYLSGTVLSVPPDIIAQQGPTCGFTASECVSNFQRAWAPSLFSDTTRVYARKCNQPKDAEPTLSLRALRKLLNIPYHGPVYSAEHLREVIEKGGGCNAFTYDVAEYDLDRFMALVKASIGNNFPIIIPFSTKYSSHPDPNTQTSKLHWATIIGIKQNARSILLAQYGTYFDVSASDLLESYCHIPAELPEMYMAKINSEWDFFDKKFFDEDKGKTIRWNVIQKSSLADFKKLIFVAPPGINIEEKLFLRNNLDCRLI